MMPILRRLLALAACLLIAQASQGATRQLLILNWSDYLDPALIEAFERQRDVKVIESYYSTDEARTQMLLENDAEGYDLILTSGSDLAAYAKRRWIAPLEHARLANFRHIDPYWLRAFPAAQRYGVPYFWGTLGIAYRSDLVNAPISTWQQLFRPAAELRGKIAMIDDTRDLIGMSLKALGYSANSSDAGQLKAAQALLLAQKPHVRSYNYISLDETSPILSGEIVASMMYSGDALMLQAHNEHLRYVLPSEGGNLWIDYFALGYRARSPDLAYAFLDFINVPANAAQQAQYVHYATPNRAAQALLPEDLLADPVIYPDSASLASSEFYSPLPARALRLRNQISASILR
ncbi:polyamine ABC transporter substrate-binding protein [Pseudomonas zhanjiangensis]|uniref:Spermidine/putrescine ABC transporter substrate-binding protein n=1 Tax=Pseudomonas zhanjiangensis TaxID=3239015 RepID=A0ABV3YY22_9PSED